VESYEEIRNLTDDEVVQRFNQAAIGTSLGVDYWINEMFRRTTERSAAQMEDMTATIKRLTWVNLVFVILTVVVAIVLAA
jgi:amino acid permease